MFRSVFLVISMLYNFNEYFKVYRIVELTGLFTEKPYQSNSYYKSIWQFFRGCSKNVQCVKYNWTTLLFPKTNGQQIMLYFVGINATGMFKYLTQHCYKHVVVMHVLYPKKHAYLSPQFLYIMCGVFFPLLEDLKYC